MDISNPAHPLNPINPISPLNPMNQRTIQADRCEHDCEAAFYPHAPYLACFILVCLLLGGALFVANRLR